LFCATVAGANACVNLYSQTEMSKADCIEPYAYLRTVFIALPQVTSVAECMQPVGISSRTTHKAIPMNKEGKLELIESRKQHHEFVKNQIISQASHCESLNILEAGCGRRWPYDLAGIKYTLTGVDVDKEALEARKNIQSDLREEIVGDLCTVDLGAEVYDVIYCSYVLEHV
jgi:hypothetical protein